MKRIRILGLAILAVFAVGAVASATAMAAESEGVIVEKNAKELVKKGFKGKSGATVLETVGGTNIKCTSSTAVGKFNSKTEGEQEVTFEGCKNNLGGSCNSIPKVKAGQIVIKALTITFLRSIAGAILIRTTILPFGTFFKFECAGVKIEVENGFLVPVEAAQEKTLKTTYKFTATQTKGVQLHLKFENEKKEKIEESLKSENSLTKKLEQSGQEGTEEFTFEEEVQIK